MSDIAYLSEEGSPGWNPEEPHLVTSVVTGNLRDRRFGADDNAVVHIVEETAWGGMSEYTQENGTSFDVLIVGGPKVSFGGDLESNIAALNEWLRAGDDPEALRDEWFESEPYEQTSDGSLRRYRAKDEFPARRYLDNFLDEVYLQVSGHGAELVGIRVLSSGFRMVANRRRLCSVKDTATFMYAITRRWC